MQLVIPMSGSSQRFRDVGYKLPKPLIEVDNVPMIRHVVSLFPGVTDVLFICNSNDIENTNMRTVLLDICPSAKIVVIEPHKKGPVYAASQAFDAIFDTKEIIVSYCDYGTKWDFCRFVEEIRTGKFDGGIAVYKGFHPHMLGSDNYAFCKEQNGELLEIREKQPFTDNKMGEFASNGTYYFKNGALLKKYFRELLALDINTNGEYYVSLVYNLMVRDGLRTKLFEIEKMLQWGTPYDLEIYKGWSKYFASRREADKQDFTLIFPMGGKGERFSKEGYTVAKPFLKVDGIPMFVRALRCLPEYKNNVIVCLEEHHSYVEEYCSLNKIDGTVCTIESVTDGQATTCEIGIEYAEIDPESPILISACDNEMLYDKQKFADLVADQSNDVIVWSFRNNQTSKVSPEMYSWLDVSVDGIIGRVSCKKFPGGDPLKTHAIIGTMYFRKAKYFLDGLKKNRERNIKVNGEFYVDDVLNRNIEDGLKVTVFEVDHYICWGTPNDLKTYNYWRDYFAHDTKH